MEREIIAQAAHVLYSAELANEFEQRGGSFGCGRDVCEVVPELDFAEHEPIIGPIIARIETGLGAKIDDIFAAGGITDTERALTDLLLGFSGIGISIQDRFSDEWEAGCKALGVNSEYHDYFAENVYCDLACTKLDEAGYEDRREFDGNREIETEDETEFNETGAVAIAYLWHGGQESSLYAFASTQTVQSEAHRQGILDEIEQDQNLVTKQEGYECDLKELARLEAVVKRAKIGAKLFHAY